MLLRAQAGLALQQSQPQGNSAGLRESTEALQTWLARIPEFHLADPAAVTWAGGQVRGPRQCLVKFD